MLCIKENYIKLFTVIKYLELENFIWLIHSLSYAMLRLQFFQPFLLKIVPNSFLFRDHVLNVLITNKHSIMKIIVKNIFL